MANQFTNRAIKGLIKVGNIYCPANEEFSKFEESAGTFKLNDLVINVPSDDFSALNLVLAIFSFLPNGILKWLVKIFENAQNNAKDGIIASTLRQLNLGLRGLCYSIYYSEFQHPKYTGKTPLQVIDYSINRIED